MRARLLPLAILACCFVAGRVASAQIPAPDGTQSRSAQPTTEVEIAPDPPQAEPGTTDAVGPSEVFVAVGEAPAPKPEPTEAAPATGLDPTRTAETLTNAVLNASGGWDP